MQDFKTQSKGIDQDQGRRRHSRRTAYRYFLQIKFCIKSLHILKTDPFKYYIIQKEILEVLLQRTTKHSFEHETLI